MSLITVALVAVASSLVTVGTIELMRSSPTLSRSAMAIDSPAQDFEDQVAHGVEPPVSATLALPPEYEHRLRELEQRLAALELGSSSNRVPVAPDTGELPGEDDLRELVLGWVAEEREARSHAVERTGEEELRSKREYEARFTAHMFAEEHGLDDWARDEFAELFLKTAQRTAEIEASIDISEDDPEEVEARWIEFDQWVEQLERELTAQVSLELYEKIYGEN